MEPGGKPRPIDWKLDADAKKRKRRYDQEPAPKSLGKKYRLTTIFWIRRLGHNTMHGGYIRAPA